MHREQALRERYAPKIVQHVLDQIGFDVFEDVDARHESARLGRIRPLRNRWIVKMDLEFSRDEARKARGKTALASAIVQPFVGSARFQDLGDKWRVLGRGHAIVRVFVKLLLGLPVIFSNQQWPIG